MKALKTIGRLIVGCVFACCLISNLTAQTYYSAKDPDLAPLPFNPHPELEMVEVEPGIFVVDDTSIPDTQQQAEDRALAAVLSAQPANPLAEAAAAEQQAIDQ